MVVKNVLHMNAGDGETSYANNSGFQKAVILKSVPVLDETLKDMFMSYGDQMIEFPKCFEMVDLGCASGDNTLLVMSHIMDTIGDLFKKRHINNDDHDLVLVPEFEVFLNDLPDNDFNSVFKLLLSGTENIVKKRGNCFVYGLPGSFYGRLLPENSIHFAYSFSSLNWLSQVPQGLENKNKENICNAMTSPPEVYEAYANQYKRDICKFLSSRAAEIVPGGRMVLLFPGRSVEDPSTKDESLVFTMLAKILAELLAEGLVKKDDLYSFNMPMYAPCIQEVETAIESEGSFNLDKLESFRVDDNDNNKRTNYYKDDAGPLNFEAKAKMGADFVRAFMEPMLARHFGSSIMNDLFKRYASRSAEYLAMKPDLDVSGFNIVISLTKK